ncbi:MAG: NAD(P)H-dependent oxidoreductase [Anaerolineales bacterium]|nr:NAD(P)H-dependent oxidoreductase [Anaerolineales bacterium]
MSEKVKIVALGGSLRRDSITKVLLETARDVAAEKMEIMIFPLHEIPIYNNDVEVEEGFPPPVAAMREALAAADGVIFATPEYNGSLTGVLKNAIDWASRQGLLRHKPVATMGGSPGALGATKAQEHLRQICLHLGMYVLSRPTIAVPKLPDKIEEGVIVDEATREFVKQQMDTFYDWVVRLKD